MARRGRLVADVRASRRRSGRAPRRTSRRPARSRSASSVQYSCAVNARISRSRSTTRRTATDCTRPADRPERTLRDEQRAQRVADQPVDDPARLLRVDEVLVDVARVRERLPDRGLRDLAERDPAGLAVGQVRGLGDVPRDRLALAVEVGGEEDARRAAGGLLDLGELALAVRVDLVLRARSRARRRRRAGPCRGSRAGRGRGRRTRGRGSPRRGSARSSAPWRATPRSRGSLAMRRGVYTRASLAARLVSGRARRACSARRAADLDVADALEEVLVDLVGLVVAAVRAVRSAAPSRR